MLRPSIFGALSIVPNSEQASTKRKISVWPSSGCAISRPLNLTDTLTLSPPLRNLMALLTLVSKSCTSIFSDRRTSLVFKTELTVIHDSAHRRNSLGGNLDQIQVALQRDFHGVLGAHNAELGSIVANDPYFLVPDFLVDL